MSDIDQLLKKRNTLIVCGTGGVGKTTLSSVLAIRAAMIGLRSVVITADPAKRLKTSFGVEEIGNEPLNLTSELKKTIPDLKGSLHAIVPNTQQTFEQLVKILAPNPATASKLLENPIVQVLGKEYSGANEYMAMERLDMLVQSGNFDCIILDTPPSRSTLALLEAPQILSRLFEERLIRWLAIPSTRLASTGVRKALSLLEKLTGEGFITNLFEFAASMFEIQTALIANIERINTLFASASVGFVAVTTPSQKYGAELEHFVTTLREKKYAFDALILNRTLGAVPITAEDQRQPSPEIQEGLKILRCLQKYEAEAVSELKGRLNGEMFLKVSELAGDVHSLEDLSYIARLPDLR